MKRLLVITLFFFNVTLAFYTFLACEQKTTPKIQSAVKLALQPYGDFSNQEIMMANKVLDSFFKLDITILPTKKLDPRAFVKIKLPRYRADSIIKFQKEYIKVDSFDYILGLTNKDISTTKKEKVKLNPTYLDWGILGLAQLNGNSCVISTKRMDKDKHPKKFGLRFRKVVIHEFGHNLNLPHCPNTSCVMTSAVESITNIDNARLAFCDSCIAKMKLKPKSYGH
jgi:archaemetzincin